ncbi:Sperm_acrosomal protein [Hexamita inflata]|uniref:Sperm acrosomal protein n=1 Tax=Hexamita inflata TaxID=28002 RepID=A0AA86P284_9EUKA|nr:Sperm acrosomal protein [Hexamita inflata]
MNYSFELKQILLKSSQDLQCSAQAIIIQAGEKLVLRLIRTGLKDITFDKTATPEDMVQLLYIAIEPLDDNSSVKFDFKSKTIHLFLKSCSNQKPTKHIKKLIEKLATLEITILIDRKLITTEQINQYLQEYNIDIPTKQINKSESKAKQSAKLTVSQLESKNDVSIKQEFKKESLNRSASAKKQNTTKQDQQAVYNQVKKYYQDTFQIFVSKFSQQEVIQKLLIDNCAETHDDYSQLIGVITLQQFLSDLKHLFPQESSKFLEEATYQLINEFKIELIALQISIQNHTFQFKDLLQNNYRKSNDMISLENQIQQDKQKYQMDSEQKKKSNQLEILKSLKLLKANYVMHKYSEDEIDILLQQLDVFTEQAIIDKFGLVNLTIMRQFLLENGIDEDVHQQAIAQFNQKFKLTMEQKTFTKDRRNITIVDLVSGLKIRNTNINKSMMKLDTSLVSQSTIQPRYKKQDPLQTNFIQAALEQYEKTEDYTKRTQNEQMNQPVNENYELNADLQEFIQNEFVQYENANLQSFIDLCPQEYTTNEIIQSGLVTIQTLALLFQAQVKKKYFVNKYPLNQVLKQCESFVKSNFKTENYNQNKRKLNNIIVGLIIKESYLIKRMNEIQNTESYNNPTYLLIKNFFEQNLVQLNDASKYQTIEDIINKVTLTSHNSFNEVIKGLVSMKQFKIKISQHCQFSSEEEYDDLIQKLMEEKKVQALTTSLVIKNSKIGFLNVFVNWFWANTKLVEILNSDSKQRTTQEATQQRQKVDPPVQKQMEPTPQPIKQTPLYQPIKQPPTPLVPAAAPQPTIKQPTPAPVQLPKVTQTPVQQASVQQVQVVPPPPPPTILSTIQQILGDSPNILINYQNIQLFSAAEKKILLSLADIHDQLEKLFPKIPLSKIKEEADSVLKQLNVNVYHANRSYFIENKAKTNPSDKLKARINELNFQQQEKDELIQKQEKEISELKKKLEELQKITEEQKQREKEFIELEKKLKEEAQKQIQEEAKPKREYKKKSELVIEPQIIEMSKSQNNSHSVLIHNSAAVVEEIKEDVKEITKEAEITPRQKRQYKKRGQSVLENEEQTQQSINNSLVQKQSLEVTEEPKVDVSQTTKPKRQYRRKSDINKDTESLLQSNQMTESIKDNTKDITNLSKIVKENETENMENKKVQSDEDPWGDIMNIMNSTQIRDICKPNFTNELQKMDSQIETYQSLLQQKDQNILYQSYNNQVYQNPFEMSIESSKINLFQNKLMQINQQEDKAQEQFVIEEDKAQDQFAEEDKAQEQFFIEEDKAQEQFVIEEYKAQEQFVIEEDKAQDQFVIEEDKAQDQFAEEDKAQEQFVIEEDKAQEQFAEEDKAQDQFAEEDKAQEQFVIEEDKAQDQFAEEDKAQEQFFIEEDKAQDQFAEEDKAQDQFAEEDKAQEQFFIEEDKAQDQFAEEDKAQDQFAEEYKAQEQFVIEEDKAQEQFVIEEDKAQEQFAEEDKAQEQFVIEEDKAQEQFVIEEYKAQDQFAEEDKAQEQFVIEEDKAQEQFFIEEDKAQDQFAEEDKAQDQFAEEYKAQEQFVIEEDKAQEQFVIEEDKAQEQFAEEDKAQEQFAEEDKAQEQFVIEEDKAQEQFVIEEYKAQDQFAEEDKAQEQFVIEEDKAQEQFFIEEDKAQDQFAEEDKAQDQFAEEDKAQEQFFIEEDKAQDQFAEEDKAQDQFAEEYKAQEQFVIEEDKAQEQFVIEEDKAQEQFAEEDKAQEQFVIEEDKAQEQFVIEEYKAQDQFAEEDKAQEQFVIEEDKAQEQFFIEEDKAQDQFAEEDKAQDQFAEEDKAQEQFAEEDKAQEQFVIEEDKAQDQFAEEDKAQEQFFIEEDKAQDQFVIEEDKAQDNLLKKTKLKNNLVKKQSSRTIVIEEDSSRTIRYRRRQSSRSIC